MSEDLETIRAVIVEDLASIVAKAIKTGKELETADMIETVRRILLVHFGETIGFHTTQSLADMETAARRLRERASSSGTRT